jgi:cytochrome d ubiquinol oxidase subunit I
MAFSGVLGFVAIEAGWFVTEFGRQPWVIYQVMRTEDGATTRDGIWVLLIVFAVIYSALAIGLAAVLGLLERKRWRLGRPKEEGTV